MIKVPTFVRPRDDLTSDVYTLRHFRRRRRLHLGQGRLRPSEPLTQIDDASSPSIVPPLGPSLRPTGRDPLGGTGGSVPPSPWSVVGGGLGGEWSGMYGSIESSENLCVTPSMSHLDV